MSSCETVVPDNSIMIQNPISGFVGPSGPQGIKGLAGDRGSSGPQGRAGAKGIEGLIGESTMGRVPISKDSNNILKYR